MLEKPLTRLFAFVVMVVACYISYVLIATLFLFEPIFEVAQKSPIQVIGGIVSICIAGYTLGEMVDKEQI